MKFLGSLTSLPNVFVANVGYVVTISVTFGNIAGKSTYSTKYEEWSPQQGAANEGGTVEVSHYIS